MSLRICISPIPCCESRFDPTDIAGAIRPCVFAGDIPPIAQSGTSAFATIAVIDRQLAMIAGLLTVSHAPIEMLLQT